MALTKEDKEFLEKLLKLSEKKTAIMEGKTKSDRANLLKLSGDAALGTTVGVFIADEAKGEYCRYIEGYGTFYVHDDIQQEYELPVRGLRITRPYEYPNATKEEKDLIEEVIALLIDIRNDWTAYSELGCADYSPSWKNGISVSYMKVLQRQDRLGRVVECDPGVYAVYFLSPTFFSSLQNFIRSQTAIIGNEFLVDMFGRKLDKTSKYLINVTRPQLAYQVSINSIMAPVTLTQGELDQAKDLDTEFLDTTIVDGETLEKWRHLLTDMKNDLKVDVHTDSVPPEVV